MHFRRLHPFGLRSLRRGLPLLILGLTATLANEIPAGPVTRPPWAMYQADASHSGYVPFSLGQRPVFSIRWRRKLGDLSLNPVTAADGKVFVSQAGYFNNPSLVALNAISGATLWTQSYGQNINSLNPPSYSDGRVYVQTGNHAEDTYLRCYNAETGQEVFRAPHLAQWESYLAPTLFDGTVYVNGGYYGGMYAFDAVTGQQRWFADLPQYDEWTPAVDENYAYAYVGEGFPGLYVIDRHTGAEAYRIPDPDFDWNGWSMELAPVLGAARNVLVVQSGRLICFDLDDRDIRWQLPGNYSGQPAVHGGTVYAISGGSLAAHNEMTGQLLWTWAPQVGNLQGAVMIAQDHLVVETDTALYAVSLATHRQTATFPASGHLALGEGMLYVAKSDGMLLALGLGTPRIALSRNSIAFGGVRRGSSVNRGVTVRNRGNADLVVFNVSGLAPPFQYVGPALPLTVAPGKSAELRFTFAPGARSLVRQTAVLETNAAPPANVSIKLSGKGL